MTRRSVGTAAVVAALTTAGCGSKLSSQAQSAANNPQVKADQARAEKIIQGCERKSNFFTHSGRQAFIHCIAPPGKTVQVEKCAQAKLASAHLFTHSGRKAFFQNVTTCIL